MERTRTIWATDLEQFNTEDQKRWSFGGGGKAPSPPEPPPPVKDDRRPDDSKSEGIESAARARSTQRKKGSRGGLKIAMGSGTGVSTPGQSGQL